MSLARVACPLSHRHVVGEHDQVAGPRLAAGLTEILMFVSVMGGHEQQAQLVEELLLHLVAVSRRRLGLARPRAAAVWLREAALGARGPCLPPPRRMPRAGSRALVIGSRKRHDRRSRLAAIDLLAQVLQLLAEERIGSDADALRQRFGLLQARASSRGVAHSQPEHAERVEQLSHLERIAHLAQEALSLDEALARGVEAAVLDPRAAG